MPHNICIIIFTCNRPDDLKRCLDSISRQSHKDFEVFAIDNGQDRESEETLKSYGIKTIRDRTKKLSYLFNLGWRRAEKELLVYLADDVELDKDWVKEAVASLARYPDAAVITGPLVSPFEYTGQMHELYTRAGKNPLLRLFAKFYNDFILEGKAFSPCVLCESGGYTMGQGFKPNFTDEREVDLATSSCMMIRRSAIASIGGFDENFIFNHADGDLFIRLRKQGFKIIYNPNMQAVHYTRLGPSRYPFFIGRDTAFFYLKDIRPRSLRGIMAAIANIFVLNIYWVYQAIRTKDVKQLAGISGFIKGVIDYIKK